MSVVILPVIHFEHANQAMRNAERAIEAGCAGVMLIEMRGRNEELPFAGSAIKRRWPDAHVGINHLSSEIVPALHSSFGACVDSTWTDEQLTHSQGDCRQADRAEALMRHKRSHALFCAVAFKYQPHEPNPSWAAVQAVSRGFIPTTSGPGTGMEADVAAVAAVRAEIGPAAPLAIASGVTPENAASYLPHVSHVLVSTGVSASFHEFDPARLRSLVAVAAG